LRLTRCILHPLQIDRGAGDSKGDVLGQRGVRKIDALWHVSNAALPCAHKIAGHGLPIHQDLALGRHQQAHEQIERGALTAASTAH